MPRGARVPKPYEATFTYENKLNMLAMLDLGIHPIQREGYVPTLDAKKCRYCDKGFERPKQVQAHETTCARRITVNEVV